MDDTHKTKDLGLQELNHQQFAQAPDSFMQELTNQWLAFLVKTDTTGYDRIYNLREAISQFGHSEQHTFWKLNDRLKHPLEKLIGDSESGGKVTKLLGELQLTVLKINPPKQAFWSGIFNRFKLLFSLKESTWHIWLEDYPSHKQNILKITDNLEAHKRQLKRNNLMLMGDKNSLNSALQLLESSFDMISCLEKRISHETVSNQTLSTELKQLLLDEFLPEIQNRLVELQQQLLIARQSVMVMDLFINQNKHQIRGIEQAIYTTASAIEITASIFMLKQSQQFIDQSSDQSEHNNLAVKGKVNSRKLKLARQLIDQALGQIEALDSVPNNTLKLKDIKNK